MVDLVVFLGNPGKQYEATRHNAGWMVAPQILATGATHAAPPSQAQQKAGGRYETAHLGGNRVWFLWPETFMNRSGECVGRFASFFRVEPGRVLVVHDELELPFGTVSLRRGGGLGGHNGLRSIQSALTTPEFMRLRIGISRPQHGSVSSWVLSRFAAEEEPFLPHILRAAADCLEAILHSPSEELFTQFRRKEAIPPAGRTT
ncbi:MAG: aminoacyl-tRNA hydrolase [Spirochaetaceae bacterium]|nr:MAG: aminoacyl-tRNA hydrolase [Spirochaetaceae bacterium]